MNLGSLRVSTKIFILVGLLIGVAGVNAATGYFGLTLLSERAANIDTAATEIRIGARMSQNVVELNRAEFRVAANPEAIEEVARIVETVRAELEDRMARARASADAEQIRLLDEAEKALANYLPELEETLRIAREVGGSVQLGDSQRAIVSSVQSSREEASRLRDVIANYVNLTDSQGEAFATAAREDAASMTGTMIAITIGGLVLGLFLGYLFAIAGTVKPMTKVVDNLKQLSTGDMNITVYGNDRKDEIGDIARTLDVFRANMIKTREMEEEARQREIRVQQERRQEMLRMADSFEQNVGSIVATVSAAAEEMQSTAANLSAMSEQASTQSATVAAASEEASANVQTVASATEELSSSISEIAQQVARSSEMANNADRKAEATRTQMEGLATAAEKIGEVVNLINDVADQTNLLALNATIEAARAGDAGKGFAVVANEVKNLAGQVSRATDEISGQVAAVQAETRAAVDAIGSIVSAIRDVSQTASAIASAVEEQGAATQEIASNVQQAAMGTEQVASNIQGVNQAATETGNGANQVLEASRQLSTDSSNLRRAMDEFLERIRAA